MKDKRIKNKVKFSWDIILSCNYRCTYCFHNGKWEQLARYNRFLSPQDWRKFWEGIYNRFGSAFIDISGGEPTIYPGFFEIINLISEFHKIHICTNLSFDPEKLLEVANRENISLLASYHPQFAEITSFLSRAILLKNNDIPVVIAVVAYPPLLEQLPSVVGEFKANNFVLTIQLFQGEYDRRLFPLEYSTSELAKIKSLSGYIPYNINSPIINNQGKICPAGYSYFRITPDGNVRRCVSLEESLGNIFSSDFIPYSDPLPCPSENCFCPAEQSLINEGGILSKINRRAKRILVSLQSKFIK